MITDDRVETTDKIEPLMINGNDNARGRDE